MTVPRTHHHPNHLANSEISDRMRSTGFHILHIREPLYRHCPYSHRVRLQAIIITTAVPEGTRDPDPIVAYNPVYGTIRQNLELSHGVTERIPLKAS